MGKLTINDYVCLPEGIHPIKFIKSQWTTINSHEIPHVPVGRRAALGRRAIVHPRDPLGGAKCRDAQQKSRKDVDISWGNLGELLIYDV